MLCNASSHTVHFISLHMFSYISLCSSHRIYSFLWDCYSKIYVMIFTSSDTWPFSKYLWVTCCNYSRARASSSNIWVVHCTSSRTQDSSRNLCVVHYISSHALSSSTTLCVLHKKFFCYEMSNLGGACVTFLIFQSFLWLDISPCSMSIYVLVPTWFITHTSNSSWLFSFLHDSIVTMLQCAFFSSYFFNKSK